MFQETPENNHNNSWFLFAFFLLRHPIPPHPNKIRKTKQLKRSERKKVTNTKTKKTKEECTKQTRNGTNRHAGSHTSLLLPNHPQNKTDKLSETSHSLPFFVVQSFRALAHALFGKIGTQRPERTHFVTTDQLSEKSSHHHQNNNNNRQQCF